MVNVTFQTFGRLLQIVFVFDFGAQSQIALGVFKEKDILREVEAGIVEVAHMKHCLEHGGTADTTELGRLHGNQQCAVAWDGIDIVVVGT